VQPEAVNRAEENDTSRDAKTRRACTWERTDWVILYSILALGVLIRIVYFWQYRANPIFDYPMMDSQYYDQWAQDFAAGRSFMEGAPYFRAPLYSWFLGVCHKLFGVDYAAPRIVQSLLGVASSGLVFLVGRFYFGRWVGAAAGAIAASFWLFVYFENELLITPLIVFLCLLFLWLLTRAHASGSLLLHGACGLVLGAAALARPNVLLFGLCACVWILFAFRGTRACAFKRAFLLGAACLVVILPVTVRNAVEGDDLVLISSQGGVNFFIGNNQNADGKSAVVPGTRPGVWEGYHDSIALAEEAEGRKLKPSEVSRHYFGKSFAFIGERTGDWLELTLKKLGFFWNKAEYTNNQPIRFFAEEFAPVVRFLPIGFGLIVPLSILGLAFCFRRPHRLFPLWGFVLCYTASVVLFFVCTRFKMPVMPVLIILACEAVRILIGAARRKKWIPIGCCTLVLVPLSLWVNHYPDWYVSAGFTGYELIGHSRLNRGDLDGAIEYYSKAVERFDEEMDRYDGPPLLKPRYGPSLHGELGTALLRKGEIDSAEKELRLALEMEPRHISEWALPSFGMAYIARKRGNNEEAIRLYENTTRCNPAFSDAYYQLGRLFASMGRAAEALRSFRDAVEVSPRFAEARVELGRTLAQQNKIREGIAEIESAQAIKPQNVQGWLLLADLYQRTGQVPDAVRALREARSKLPPGSPQARQIDGRLRKLQGR